MEDSKTTSGVREELGPIGRRLAERYFEPVRFPPEAVITLTKLHAQGFVVHVMRTTGWVNYLYLTWALVRRALPPVRAVVNLRRWFTRPWRKTAQRGDFDVRFTYARREGGSALVFLKRSAFGRAHGKTFEEEEDPFPALVTMARKSDRAVYLVPELFVWEKWSPKLKPGLIDFLFGSPEAPSFVHSLVAFFRNYQRAQFRVGEPVDLRKFVLEHASESDELIARKVRSAIHHHLARETRAVFGPPWKPADRLIDEAMRDRGFRKSVDEIAAETKKSPEQVTRDARKNLESIASRYHPTVVAISAPIMGWIFDRIYDGIHVDEAGFERAMRAAAKAPIVLVPSHKSHVDYLVMSYVLWTRGYTIPLVAAGANLSFWPLGPFLRRGGAFFLRRSFKGDKLYTAAFKAYVKKLVHDGLHQEFFPEGGRSRTGKLLTPKLGLLTWEVEAVLEGARDDLTFVPVAIDYEKVVESSSYSRELAGGEKKAENLGALLKTPKVLAAKYGSIHLSFDEPISLAEFMKARGLAVTDEIGEEPKKALVRALGHRIMYGISRVSTVTEHALVASALLAHARRGISATDVAHRVGMLRRIAEEEGVPLSRTLSGAPSDPTIFGPVKEAMDGFVTEDKVQATTVKNETIYQAVEKRRPEMAFYKNTLMNLVAPRSQVAAALRASKNRGELSAVRERTLFLSRLFKFEFVYKVGETFETRFAETVERLVRSGLVTVDGEVLSSAQGAFTIPELDFLADLSRDYLESYLIAVLALKDLAERPMDRKEFLKVALETGRAEFLAGRVSAAEALSRTTLENALLYLLDQSLVEERDKKLVIGSAGNDGGERDALAAEIRSYL